MNDEVRKALNTVQKGGIILYPTDTIWGIGCDATNDEAVRKIFKIKDRADTRQMLILIDKADNISKYVRNVPDIAFNFIESAQRPLSIIFQNAWNLAPSLIGHDNTIGIRVVQDDFCKELIGELGKPIVSTSANISGKPPPTGFINIDPQIKESVDHIVSLRQDEVVKSGPSDIIKFEKDGEIVKIR
ncbi:MAG: L-threonylcarbamoyladenylate synthase [Bacteroidales bacterium]